MASYVIHLSLRGEIELHLLKVILDNLRPEGLQTAEDIKGTVANDQLVRLWWRRSTQTDPQPGLYKVCREQGGRPGARLKCS